MAGMVLSRLAYDKISRAQRANRSDVEGHAQHAKVLLDQINDELKLSLLRLPNKTDADSFRSYTPMML